MTTCPSGTSPPTSSDKEQLREIRDRLEEISRLDGPFFDADGVLRSAINVRTLQPFTTTWGATQTQPKLPEPLAVNYAQATTYEDVWMAIGLYLEYLRARHNVTGERHLVGEMRRCTQLVIDVYREDNPGSVGEWETRNGFFRRLYAGRHGAWPYPETLGTDQLAALMWGLREVRDQLDEPLRKGVDEVAVGALGWYMRRNFAYIYRGTVIHHLDWGEHALAYYIPALLWAQEVTGEPAYLRAYGQLHTQYLYNPEHYLRVDAQRPIVYYQSAFKWSMWVTWLCEHAPNANFYRQLAPQFVRWYTTLLNNTLPSGLGHDYDNHVYSDQPYPTDWIDQPFHPDPTVKTHDGYDVMASLNRSRKPPLQQLRNLSAFALAQPGAVDVTPIVKILPLCDTFDRFTSWYDPEDKIVPTIMNHRCWGLQTGGVYSWLTTYWRLRKLGTF